VLFPDPLIPMIDIFLAWITVVING